MTLAVFYLHIFQSVLPNVVQFIRIQAAALIQSKVFLGYIRIKNQDIIRIDRYVNAVAIEFGNGMSLQASDPLKKIVAGGCEIQPDMIVCQKMNYRRIFHRCNSVLHLVQFKVFHGTADILCCSPFADMSFCLKSGCLCTPVDGLEILYWLCQFIPIQIDRIECFASPEMRQAVL